MIEEIHQNLQTFVARQLFVKLPIGPFSLGETAKSFCRLFHDENINLAASLSERI
jgi:hypothetical protein